MHNLPNLRSFRGRKHVARSRERYRRALNFKRFRSSLEDSYQFQTFVDARQWLAPLFDAIEEMLAFGFQWLLLFDVRDVAVPIVIRVVEVGEGVVMRRALNPDIVDSYFFVRLQIVVHDHAACAHDGHLTNFSGFEPTALDRRKSLMPERERNVGHVLDAWGDMGVTLAVNRQRQFS